MCIRYGQQFSKEYHGKTWDRTNQTSIVFHVPASKTCGLRLDSHKEATLTPDKCKRWTWFVAKDDIRWRHVQYCDVLCRTTSITRTTTVNSRATRSQLAWVSCWKFIRPARNLNLVGERGMRQSYLWCAEFRETTSRRTAVYSRQFSHTIDYLSRHRHYYTSAVVSSSKWSQRNMWVGV